MSLVSDEDRQPIPDDTACEFSRSYGTIQDFACLLVFDAESQAIRFASENCPSFLGLRLETILESTPCDLLGPMVWHEISGAAHEIHTADMPTPIGSNLINERPLTIAVFAMGNLIGLEIEDPARLATKNIDGLRALRYLTRHIRTCADPQSLFQVSAEMLRNMSGYDRVTVFKFGIGGNGEVLAEAHGPGIDSSSHMHFPRWTLPTNAPADMRRVPPRIVEDVDQVPVAVVSQDAESEPLKLTNATSRGVSSAEAEDLRALRIRAAMTLTVVQDGAPWGLISFHHRTPRLPAVLVREVLVSFLAMFEFRLQTLIQSLRL